MHDAEDKDDAVLIDGVIHDPAVADPQSVEGIADPLNSLDRFAGDPPRFPGATRQIEASVIRPRTSGGIFRRVFAAAGATSTR